MLDADTKRRIDTARDILVGKVPDPKSQVEQITIALIYKFMDDMDLESEELGGQRQFFAGDFARYGWAKLMRSGLGGFETLNLYAEAISMMPQNAGIPALFRDIFKNAYLPYRDPETLRAFLKVIDEFNYDHSERLGDAFEYLLSVLGSQGDAGMFRTPRHIIDFMVAVVDPQKSETVLDPACGTAGFLISSYKHILKANTDAEGHSTLTPDERGRLAANIKGYDISPDMVRLSLVNLYLHGFVAPRIYEYDTLTSLERWNETANVILANPPFMSPKGGIIPHKRFGVQSKRSEVLFVDYMAEHLTPNGRAGIIVPEGIIFRSATAYTHLRRMLVEDYLVAVVSLPAGVFNPYSGVKTSILFLDKSLAKQAGSIAFFKVENDGFGLGAQRRAVEGSDLPAVAAEIAEYLRRLRSYESLEGFEPAHGLVAPKAKIAADGDYNLSAERYRENGRKSSTYPILTLGEVADVVSGQSPPGTSYNKERLGTPFFQGKTEFGDIYLGTPTSWTTDPQRFADEGDILISVRAPVGPVNIAKQRICIGRGLAAIKPNPAKIIPLFVFHILHAQEKQITGDAGTTFSSINRDQICKIKIPLPPLEVQREIVAEIEGYQKVIDGARAVLEGYRPHIPIDPAWEMVALGEVCVINPKKTETDLLPTDTEVSFVPMADLEENSKNLNVKGTKILKDVNSSYTYFKDGDVLIAKVTPCFENGKAGIARNLKNGIGFGSSEYYVLRPTDQVIAEWVYLYVASPGFRDHAIPQMTGTGGLQRVPRSVIENYKIPVPSLKTQERLIAEIESEQALVGANRELIERMERKIQATLARVWGEGCEGGL